LSRRRVCESGCDTCGLRANRRALKHRAVDRRLQETRDRVPTLWEQRWLMGARHSAVGQRRIQVSFVI
jgi:hypothetical protein